MLRGVLCILILPANRKCRNKEKAQTQAENFKPERKAPKNKSQETK
jgi:hypothetical protein